MRVLHIFHEIKYSGGEIMYATAAGIFQQNNVELYAFSTSDKLGDYAPQFEKRNIKTYLKTIDFSFLSPKGYRFYKKFYRFLKDEKIDILHIHRNDLMFIAFVARLAGVKSIKTCHNVFHNRWFTRPYAILQRWLLRNFCNVTFQTIGDSVYTNELKYYFNPSVKINNWFDETKFYPSSNNQQREKIRTDLQIPLNAFVFISIGNCSTIKNHQDIIKAVPLINREHESWYVHLGSGSIEEEEKQLAQELKTGRYIKFMGTRANVSDYLAASDIFVMSSQFEGLSIAAIEAMACGLPGVLYNVPGLRDVIENDDNGFLVNPDYEQLAEKILLFSKDPALVKQKGEKAKIFAQSNYGMSVNVPKIIELYRSKL